MIEDEAEESFNDESNQEDSYNRENSAGEENEEINEDQEDDYQSERPEKQIPKVEEKMEVKIPYKLTYDFKHFDVYETKLGNLTAIQDKLFNKDTYKPEEPIILTDDKGKTVEKKIPLENYIRWKYSDSHIQKDTTEKLLLEHFNIKPLIDKEIVSNARIVEWSDGSFQMAIGSHYYDIILSDANNLRFTVDCPQHHVQLLGSKIRSKMILKKSQMLEQDSEDLDEFTSISNVRSGDSKVKTTHFSYFEKNKYSKEDFSSRSGKLASFNKQLKQVSREKKREEQDYMSRKRKRSEDL